VEPEYRLVLSRSSVHKDKYKSPNNSIELCGRVVRKGAGSIREGFEWKTCQTRLPKLRWGEQVRKIVIQKGVRTKGETEEEEEEEEL
jgi:hypothetical protein